MTPMQILLVALAGGLGAGLRYILDVAIQRGRRGVFPLGILIVNVTGSLALGIVTGLGDALAAPVVAILGVGLLGGYTTFSTVSTESALLLQTGRRDWGWLNLIGTAVSGVIAAAVGLLVGGVIGGLIPR
ncbi:CrcB family protein [Microbacterium sp. NPDC064584]|uniref:fluoride efflux transporter FluC n=1 Tax=Microbacterium sp. NPDC064584 TaxID=3155817 RepID=UPI00342EEE4B